MSEMTGTFILGLAIGLFSGASIGYLFAALIAAGKNADLAIVPEYDADAARREKR